MTSIVRDIPARFWGVPYNGERTPLAGAGFGDGANCQHFSYELLRHFGRKPADLYSSDLWNDAGSRRVAAPYEPLDLLLFNRSNEAYAAHLAVYVGDDQAIHLAKSVGHPVVWRIDEFLVRPEYAVLVGAIRCAEA